MVERKVTRNNSENGKYQAEIISTLTPEQMPSPSPPGKKSSHPIVALQYLPMILSLFK